MILKELVELVEWVDIKDSAIFRRESDANKEGYRVVLEKLKTLEPIKSNLRILIYEEPMKPDDNDYVEGGIWLDVSIVDGALLSDGVEELMSAIGMPWKDWLGCEIDDNTSQEYSFESTVADCLYEMTFSGFVDDAFALRYDGFDLDGKEIFLSHASEDKPFARSLYVELCGLGMSVWMDEFEIKIGDSIRHKIRKALSSSKYGVVVLSRSFIQKQWTEHELNGLITGAMNSGKIVLPIWHEISAQEIIEYDSSLADIYALKTQHQSVKEIALKIHDVYMRDLHQKSNE